jgi:hypothetical protein
MILETGYNNSFEVRHEQYAGNCGSSFTILYLSDLHFNKYSEAMAVKIISTIHQLDPDIILLGGDYVDSKKGLVYLDRLLQSISNRKNILAIAGNHDHYFGLDAIKKMMTANNISWIENSYRTIEINGITIRVDGNTPNSNTQTNDFAILCMHKPSGIKNFARYYQLAFAGHLHGCQFVLWQTAKGLYPGKFFYKWNLLKTRLLNCEYYISKGLGDTLPVRFNCKKDMIFVKVTSN